MLDRMRGRLTFANVVSMIALFASLTGGVALAALARDSVKAKQIAANAVRAEEIKDGEVGGNEVNESSLGTVPSATNATNAANAANAQNAQNANTATSAGHATTANSAGNADTAADAQNLGGVGPGQYLRLHCLTAASQQVGKVNGFARVKGRAAMPATYSTATADVDTDYNCAGSEVEVRRAGAGQYFVRFPGNGAELASASLRLSSAEPGDGIAVDQFDNTIVVTRIFTGPDAGAFRVDITDESGAAEDQNFQILLP